MVTLNRKAENNNSNFFIFLYFYVLLLTSYLYLLTLRRVSHHLHFEGSPDERTYTLGIVVADGF